MARFNRPTYLVIISLVVIFTLYYGFQQQKYTIKDFSTILESLEITGSGEAETGTTVRNGRIINNKDPALIEKHEIENKVNELLKKKLEDELAFERQQMDLKSKEYDDELRSTRKEKAIYKKKKQMLEDKFNQLVTLNVRERRSESPSFIQKTYSFKTNSKASEVEIDGDKNDLVLLSAMTQEFDEQGGKFLKFMELLESFDYPKYKTSVSLLISSQEEFTKVDKYISGIFSTIEKSEDLNSLKESFSKITLINAQFIEDEFKVNRGDRHDPSIQKKRRKLIARLRNFLVFNGIGAEIYSLSIDSDIIELPKDLITTFIESGKDIATIRIDMKNDQGTPVHKDYDLNSWAGDRKSPSPEQEADPNLFFEPGPGPNKVQFLDLWKDPKKYGLTKSDPKSYYELNSVGGAVLFVKTEVYKQGIMFPPYYAIGTKWESEDGWDGIETEGLCYQAKTIGYSCWGFPFIIGYHEAS